MKSTRIGVLSMRTLAVAFLVATASVALAVPPHAPQLVAGGNMWTITFYDDTNPVHAQWATQRICFLDGHGEPDDVPEQSARASSSGDGGDGSEVPGGQLHARRESPRRRSQALEKAAPYM